MIKEIKEPVNIALTTENYPIIIVDLINKYNERGYKYKDYIPIQDSKLGTIIFEKI